MPLSNPQNPSTPWINADLGNRWLNYGFPFAPASYRLSRGIVYLRGGIVSQGVYQIFTLPVGYRPPYQMNFPVGTYQSGYGAAIGMVSIGADGLVSWGELGYGEYFSLDGIQFWL